MKIYEGVDILNFVSVCGYGWTGSSAYVSILKEFTRCDSIGKEFRLIKDPFGLIDLQNSLMHNWEFIRHDVAIRDFLWFCKILSRKGSLVSGPASNYNELLSSDFYKISCDYIESITDLTYVGDSSVHRYRSSNTGLFFNKLKSKFGIYNNTGIMRISKPTNDKFIYETKLYIENIFNNFCKKNEIDTVVLDQAIPVLNINNAMKLFDSMKVIIVDRDPRDIYVNLIKRRKLIGYELSNNTSVNKYIKWHKLLRSHQEDIYDKKNILRINFEDIVLDYKPTLKKINLFLGDRYTHDKSMEFFDPLKAIKSIGLWKKYEDQNSIKEIQEYFPQQCIKY
mgnify:CR=1 FL=1